MRVLEVGHGEDGALGFLRFFAQLEIERATQASRFAPTYVVQHPSPSMRIAVVKTAAKDHRSR